MKKFIIEVPEQFADKVLKDLSTYLASAQATITEYVEPVVVESIVEPSEAHIIDETSEVEEIHTKEKEVVEYATMAEFDKFVKQLYTDLNEAIESTNCLADKVTSHEQLINKIACVFRVQQKEEISE